MHRVVSVCARACVCIGIDVWVSVCKIYTRQLADVVIVVLYDPISISFSELKCYNLFFCEYDFDLGFDICYQYGGYFDAIACYVEEAVYGQQFSRFFRFPFSVKFSACLCQLNSSFWKLEFRTRTEMGEINVANSTAESMPIKNK